MDFWRENITSFIVFYAFQIIFDMLKKIYRTKKKGRLGMSNYLSIFDDDGKLLQYS